MFWHEAHYLGTMVAYHGCLASHSYGCRTQRLPPLSIFAFAYAIPVANVRHFMTR